MRRMSLLALAAVLSITLAACGVVSKGNRKAAMQAPNGDGIYVASVPVADVQDLLGIGFVHIMGWDLTEIPYGVEQIYVANRWNGVVGVHKEETQLLDRKGRAVVVSGSELSGQDRSPLQRSDLAQTTVDALDISKLLPGYYEIAVFLDGVERARYAMRIIAPPEPANGGTATRKQ